MNKVLTVVVPSYNMEQYLPKCLGSLVVRKEDGSVDEELLSSLEVLVINDGSKDRTSEIGHEFEKQYPGVFRCIDKPNGHYGSCVNRGLKEATGTFIRVLDADDYVNTSTFNDFLNLLCSFSPHCLPDAVITDYSTVTLEGKTIKKFCFPYLPEKKMFSFSEIENICKGYFQNHDLTYRTEILQKIEYQQTEGVPYTDVEWFIIPMIIVEKVVYFPRTVVHYLLGREGQTVNNQVLLNNYQLIEKIIYNIILKIKKLNCKSTSGGYKFVKERLLQSIGNIYKQVIILSCQNKNMQKDLIQFDQLLKENTVFLYNMSDSFFISDFLHFHYIREWRKKYTTRTIKFLLYKLYTKVIFIIFH